MYLGKLYNNNKHPQKKKYKENNYWYVLCQAKEGKKRQNIAAIATDLTPKSLNVVVRGDHQKP